MKLPSQLAPMMAQRFSSTMKTCDPTLKVNGKYILTTCACFYQPPPYFNLIAKSNFRIPKRSSLGGGLIW